MAKPAATHSDTLDNGPSDNNRLRLVVLISGNGSNLQAVLDAISSGELLAEIAAVISNRRDAYGLQRAGNHRIPTHVLDHQEFEDREQYDQQLALTIDHYQPDLVLLAGRKTAGRDD